MDPDLKETALAARRKRKAGGTLSEEESDALRTYYRRYSDASLKIYLWSPRDRDRFRREARKSGRTLSVWMRDMAYRALSADKDQARMRSRERAQAMQQEVEQGLLQMDIERINARLRVFEAALKAAGANLASVRRAADVEEAAAVREFRHRMGLPPV